VELHVFGEAFNEEVMTKLLPGKYDMRSRLDISFLNDLLKLKALKANNNGIGWLRMSSPLPQHQHAINKSRSTEYPSGIAYIAIEQLTVQVILAPEMAASIL
jgi:hypothetical protein